MIEDELDNNADYLGHLESTLAYLKKIDDRQLEVTSAMDRIGVYSVLMGGVTLQMKRSFSLVCQQSVNGVW